MQLAQSWEAKRDKWNGYDPSSYKEVIEEHAMKEQLKLERKAELNKEKMRIKLQKREERKRKKEINKKQEDASSEDSSSEDDLSESSDEEFDENEKGGAEGQTKTH